MRRLSYAVSTLATAMIQRSARLGGLLLISMLVMSAPSASALGIASGSKCTVNWVNNAGALACFVQGEQDSRNGVSNPHYVACSAAGETFCCVDDSKGNQSCEVVEAVVKGGKPIQATQLEAVLDAQQTILMKLNQLSKRMDSLESKLSGANSKAAP
jgi:hypothetical protein